MEGGYELLVFRMCNISSSLRINPISVTAWPSLLAFLDLADSFVNSGVEPDLLKSLKFRFLS